MPRVINREKFFSTVRDGLFRGRLSQSQVDNMEALLKVWEDYYIPKGYLPEQLAYLLATAKLETGHTMAPIKERGSRAYFNRYDIKHNRRKALELGNTLPGDGYKFRGFGHVQNTGKRNAKKASERLNEVFGIKVDLVANPEKRLDPFISAHSLFLGCLEGWWTGKKIDDYINGNKKDYPNARRVVNGTDKQHLIAGYAHEFEEAIDYVEVSIPANVKEHVTGKPAHKSLSNWLMGSVGSLGAAATAFTTVNPYIQGLILALIAGGVAYFLYERRRKRIVEGY